MSHAEWLRGPYVVVRCNLVAGATLRFNLTAKVKVSFSRPSHGADPTQRTHPEKAKRRHEKPCASKCESEDAVLKELGTRTLGQIGEVRDGGGGLWRREHTSDSCIMALGDFDRRRWWPELSVSACCKLPVSRNEKAVC